MASLGKDISKIRQDKNLTIEQIHEQTRIPVRILNTIEEGSLFEDIDENKTYIRSYVRSYAKALGIQNERIISCLNKAEAGDYNGELLSPSDSLEDQATVTTDSKADETQTPEDSNASTETDADVGVGGAESQKKQKPKQKKSRSSLSKHWSYDQSAQPEPSVHSLNWAKVGEDISSFRDFSAINIALTILVLFVLGGVVYFFVFRGEQEPVDSASTTEPSGTALSVDSLDNEFITIDTANSDESTTNVSTEPQQLEELQDTLTLVIYAAYDKLEPVRVNSDVTQDTLPYWIEEGQAMRFEFIDSIRVRGQFDRMELLFQGHVIQNFREKFYQPLARLLVLSRNDFTEPKWLTAPPDSLQMAAPPPDTTKPRPIF